MRGIAAWTAWRMAAVAFTGLALASCASRPPPALAPTVAAPPGAEVVDLLVSTTRRPDNDPALMFGGLRTLTPRFASLSVSIPPGHKPGEIAWSTSTPPDPGVSFAAVRTAHLDRDGFVAALRQSIRRTGRSHVLIFVHGYNTRFDEAAFRFAQIVKDSAAPVTPVLFSWSSWGTLSAYPYDRTSASISRDGLESLMASLAAEPEVREISVLAHSMGGFLTMEAMKQMAVRRGRLPPKLGNLMLAAPDIDVDVAQEQGRAFGPKRPRITLFVSRDDGALNFSRFVWGSRDQLGAIDPNKEPYKTNLARFGVEVIDLTDVSSADRLGHGKFAQSPEVVRSIGLRLATGQRLAGESNDVGEGATILTRGTLNAAVDVLTTPLRIVNPQQGPQADNPAEP